MSGPFCGVAVVAFDALERGNDHTMAPTLRRGSKPVTLCVTAQHAIARGRRWSVEGCMPMRSVATINEKARACPRLICYSRNSVRNA